MNTHKNKLTYALISPARNEEAYVEKTIHSVLSQTVLPVRWVIVSDGSTDGTDAIVKKYLPGNPWIRLLRMPEHRDRQFAAKVHCFNIGHKDMQDATYDIIGNLDADISFDSDYFEFLLDKFYEVPDLGVAGTPFVEESGYSSSADSFEGGNHVAGGCQLFRRTCFEEIGGYIPIRGGGIDWVAVTTARMKGWKTRSFNEKQFFHYRSLGTGESNSVASTFKYGKKDWFLGGHPLWQMFRVAYRMTKKPYIAGGIILLAGYLYAQLHPGIKRHISPDLMRFHRKEHMHKLRIILSSMLSLKRVKKY